MHELIREFLDRNHAKQVKVHCLGDAMVDEYYHVSVSRISPEAPMPIMSMQTDTPTATKPGGVANVAYQLKNFNAKPSLFYLPDRNANKVFQKHGIPIQETSAFNAQLPVKRRFLDGMQVHRLDIEMPMCGLISNEIDHFKKNLVIGDLPDVAIFSDYNKGFFAGTYNLLPLYKDCKTIVDPKKDNLEKWKGCTVFKPNASEAKQLSGYNRWQDQAKYFQDQLECQAVVITCSGQKVVGIDKDDTFWILPQKHIKVNSVVGTVGAGDCFGAIFALAIAHDFSVKEAAEIAFLAGTIYVQHDMNRPVCPAEIVSSKIVDPRDLTNRDFSLVLTNGCFDILHEGHLESLRFAKSKGEKLVVAVNSDSSVRRLKGEKRPIVPYTSRSAILAAMEFVDFVVVFDEDDPYQVIKTIKPDYIVKSVPYDKDNVVGADIAPVLICPKYKDVSTTDLINNFLR